MTSARRFVYSTFAAVNFLVCAEALHVLSAVVAPAASVVGHGAWASAACYVSAWLLQSRGLAGYCKALLVRGGGAFVVMTALFAAKHALFGGVETATATSAAASKAAAVAAAKIAAAAPPVAPSLDIAAGLVGVWIVLAGTVLDAAADDTVGAAMDASRTGRPLRPAKDRAWETAARLPAAAAFAAFAVATCLNPAANLPPALKAAIPLAAALPALNAVAGPAATAVLRGTSSAAISEANVAMLAGIISVVSMGLPANAMGSAGAAFGACLFAAGAAAIAPALGVVAADYFVLRKRVVDTNLLVDDASNEPGGSFWFWNGFNPRAVLAWGVGAAFPAAEFASACVAGGSVAAEVAAGSVGGALVAPGLALARGATLGAAVSSAMYLAFNKLAPPSRAGGYTRGVQGGMYARGGAMGAIAADGGAMFVDDVIAQEADDKETLDWVARAPGAAGSEAKGQTWSRPPGGSGDDDPEDDEDTDEKVRSRLQRAFEMDTVDPETQYVDVEPEPPLDVTLGVSLQSELISQLERREDKLSELKEAKARGEKVPEATMTRVQADVDALRKELDAFSRGGFGYATNASGRLVQKSVEEITRARESARRSRDDETLDPYLDNVGAWAEVSEAAANVTKLDVAIERLVGAAEVSGKPADADEMRELQEQRTVWGLRLVSAQIKGIVGLQNEVVDKGSAVDAHGGGEDLAAEMMRLEKLSAEKSALLDRLSETERKGSEASAAAADLRREVDDLRRQLTDARAASKSEAVRAQEGFRRLLADRQALASELEGAEAARKEAETKATTEVNKLWSEVQRLQGLLGEKEGDLERIKSELDTGDLPTVRSIEERTAPLEAEIKDLRSQISQLRGEMAEKDRTAGEATEQLRAQLKETADALAATEKALEDARARETDLTAKGRAGDAEKARAAQDAAAAARRESNALREKLAEAQMKLEAKVVESKQKEEAARKSVDDARMIEAESRRAAETAQARVGEVEEALRAKEKELEAALVRAGDADRKQLSLVAVVEELTEQIANAKAKMDEKTREIADLKAFVPGPERQSEFNDALAALEAKERDLLESKGRIKALESQLAAAESPEEGFKWKNLVSRLRLDKNEARKSAARRAEELAAKDAELVAVRADIARVKAELDDMKAFVPGPERQSEYESALETIAQKERELMASKDRVDALEAALADAERARDEALTSVKSMQYARDGAIADAKAADAKAKAANADVEQLESLLEETREQLERVKEDFTATEAEAKRNSAASDEIRAFRINFDALEQKVVQQEAELAELKAVASDADAKRLEAELRAKEIEADLTAKVEAAASDSEEVKTLRSRVETSEANVAKLRADIEAKDAELELRSIGLRELAGNATASEAKKAKAVKDLKASEKARELVEQKLADLETATKIQLLVLEKKLKEKTELIAAMLPENQQLTRDRAVAGGILSRIAAKLGGNKNESWTPAKVEERLMIRLNSLEAQLEDVERERSEISELQAKSIADENALAEAAARLEASEIEKDDVQAELRKLGAEMEDMRALVAARDAAAKDLEAQATKAKTTASDATAQLGALKEKFEAAKDALAARETALAEATAAREERERALADANAARETALVEARVAREERDRVVAEAEPKSASLEEEVAKARTLAESLRAELKKASPAEEGFKWKNIAAKLRLDKNEAVKELAAKDAEIESVRAELNRRIEALESGADVAAGEAKMLSADLTEIKRQLAEKDAELQEALATADALRERNGMGEKEGFKWKELVSRLRLDKNEAEKSFARRAEEIKELRQERVRLEQNAAAAVAEYESRAEELRAELAEAKERANQAEASAFMDRVVELEEAIEIAEGMVEAAQENATERERALGAKITELESMLAEERRRNEAGGASSPAETPEFLQGGTKILKRSKGDKFVSSSAEAEVTELTSQLEAADEELDAARTRAAELEDELGDVRAELLDARVAAEAQIEDLGEKLVVLEATVAQQRDASVKLAEFEAIASGAVERAKAAEARADAADVVPAAEAEALKAEVARLESLLADKAAKMAETLQTLEAERSAAYKTQWSGVLGVFNGVVGLGKKAREAPSVKEMAGKLRDILDDIEGSPREKAAEPAVAARSEVLRSVDDDELKNILAQLEDARDRVMQLERSNSETEARLAEALAEVETLAAGSERRQTQAARDDKKSKMMERAFKVQENEIQEALAQINILRAERETAEQTIEKLTAKLAALESADAPVDQETQDRLASLTADIAEKDAKIASLEELEQEVETLTLTLGDRQLELEAARAELAAAEVAAKGTDAELASVKSQMTELKSLEARLAEAKRSAAEAETAAESLREKLAPLEKELRSVRSELDATLESAGAREAELVDRIVELETQIEAMSKQSTASLDEKANLAAKIEKISDEYAAEKAAAAKAKSELTRTIETLTAQIEETRTRAEADVAERRAAAEREARAEVDKVKSDLERVNVELDDAKTAAATAIAAAESRELTLTRRVNTLEEECEQLRVTVARAAAVEETEGEESYTAKLTGELALARAELKEMRAAFELVQEVSDEAVAAEQTLLVRVEELEARLAGYDDGDVSVDSGRIDELEDALRTAKAELAAEQSLRAETEKSLTERVESLKELDAARRRVTELESQLAAVESEGTALDAETAREMDQMKQMIEFQDEQILVAVDALDKRDAEAKRAAEDAAAKLADVRALEKRVEELQKAAEKESGRAKMMERAFKVQEEEVQDGLGQINALRSDREIAEREVETLRARLAALEASRPIPPESPADAPDTDAIRDKLQVAEAALAAKQAELEQTKADASAARARAELRMAAVVDRFRTDLVAKSDELEKRVEAVFASEEKAAAAFAAELARNAAMLAEKDEEAAALVARIESLEEEADDYREQLAVLEVELEVAYAAADDEVDDLRDRIDQLLELVRDSDKELEQLRSQSETAAALAGVESADAEKASDNETEAEKVEALREQIASLENAAKAAAKTLRAAEKERSVSEEMLRERIADLESELESSGVAAEEEIARLKTESAEIAAKLEETERRARDAEESYADALRVAAEEKDALEIEVGRLRLRAAELEDQLAERDDELRARTADLDAIRAELTDARAELAAKVSALRKAEADAANVRRDVSAAGDGAVAASSTLSWLIGGMFSDGEESTDASVVPSLDIDGPAAWAATNASLSMSARLGMLVDSRRRMLAAAETETERDALESEIAALAARRDEVARLESEQSEVEERLRAAKEIWMEQERNLRQRIRQLEASAEVAAKAESGTMSKSKAKDETSAFSDSFMEREAASKESLRILAKEAEAALAKREEELKRLRGEKAEALADAAKRIEQLEDDAARARDAVADARADAERREREAKAAQRVWAELEATLREQIEAYEQERVRREEEGGFSDDSAEDSGGGRRSGSRRMDKNDPSGPSGGSPGGDAAELRAEVEQLSEALRLKEASLESLKQANAEMTEIARERELASASASFKPAAPVMDPALQLEIDEARAEAATLREELERKDRELKTQLAREQTLSAAEAKLKSRVTDLTSQLKEASKGYDAELTRMNAELASLQTMLTQREEVFEAMQQRLNDAVESESQKRNKEISDARGEMSEMQGLLEKMAKDLQAKAAVESELRETRNKIREMELLVDDKEHLERETERLKAELAGNSDTLDQAVATVAVLANRLAETSSLAGLPPPKELVTGITKSLLDNLTGNSAKEIEASVEATAAKLVTDSASIADRIDAMLASRERDLEVARAKGKSGKLEARIADEVREMHSQRDAARALEKETAEAKAELELLRASVPEMEARLNSRIAQLEAELGDAKFDLEDERVNTRAEIEYLEAELRDRDAKVRETQAEWEAAKQQLEYELEAERAERADAAEALLAERDELRESLDALQASIESKIENALRFHEEQDELQASLEQEVAQLRQTVVSAERKLRAAEAAAKAAEAAGANAVAEIEATLRAQLAETEAKRIAAADDSAEELKRALDAVNELEARLAERERALDDERAASETAAASKTAELEDEIARLRAEAAASNALADVDAAAKVTELERALDAREAELTELRARLDGDVAASERRWETAAAEATLVRSQLADVKRELSDAESKLQQKELAAAAAAAAEATLRERLAEAETQREAAALAASEERDAFEAEVKRLERALSDAEARADAATAEASIAADERVAAMEAETKRLRAATADVQTRIEAEAAASAADRDAKSAQDSLLIATLKQRLGDAEAAAEELRADLTARLSLMTERVGILEAELEGKKGDEGEVKRLREEIVALEASRADEVEELERQVSRLMASGEKEEEVRALRKKIDEMAATMESTLGEMRQVEDSLRAKLRAAEADAVKGERLSAAREELEARLADSEATLAAEKSRLTAEAEAAAERADAEAGELRSKLNALKETLESRDVALAEANTTVEALRKANDDLDAKLLGIERDRDAAAIQLAPEIVKLRAEASAQAQKLAQAEEAMRVAKEEAAAATARAEKAEAEAESLRWQLLARDELRAATTEIEAKTVLAKAQGAAPESAMGAIRDELRRRLEGLEKERTAREREMSALEEEDARLKARAAETAGDVERSEREAAADAEVARLRSEMSELSAKAEQLEDALAAKEELVGKIQGEIPAPAPAEPPAAEPRLFEQPEDERFVVVSANAARLEVLLRRRERALAELQRLETDGATVSPVLQSYRHEIQQLDAEAAEVRAELAARDEAVLELRGRLDVELNLLARESANVRKRLLESPPSTGMPAMEPEKEQRLSDTLDKLQTDLQTAEAASTAAFEKLDRSIGAAAEVSTGGGKLMPCKFDIEFVTKPGQTVHVVGSWCDWDVKQGLELKWSEGHRWVGTMPLKPGFNYEYKYCVLERVERKQPGDAPPYWPDYGFTEPTCIMYKPGEVAMVVWQKGNNKAVALDSNVVNEGIKHVYCKDEWIPDPMTSPVQLIGEDGEVVQTVGSTKLLAQCVNRADEALAEARATIEEVMRIASETLGAASMFGRIDDEDEDDGIDRV